jgi:DNA-binding HxlR family transcriptional regulator
MADTGFNWMYLVVIIIPLARILPRVIKNWRAKKPGSIQHPMEDRSQYSKYTPNSSGTFRVPSMEKSTDMLVLGRLCDGTKNFESLQKKLNIDHETLNSILGDLENKGLIRVENKQGFFGPKVELYPTKEGIKKYHS